MRDSKTKHDGDPAIMTIKDFSTLRVTLRRGEKDNSTAGTLANSQEELDTSQHVLQCVS